jgi:hypothetical protein
MSKLFKLKEWLTISDAAKHLTTTLHEIVSEADVLQLALEGNLKISVYLVNGAIARECIVVNPSEIEWEILPLPNSSGREGRKEIKIPKAGRVFIHSDGSVMQVQKRVQLESGVFDLPLSGGERVDVEHRFQILTSGIEVTSVTLDGEFVEGNGFLYELYDGHYDDALDEYQEHPAGALPEDSVLVVRTSALIEFLRVIDNAPEKAERQIGNRERETLLAIIATLCKEAKLDYKTHAKTAGLIQSFAATMGISIGETTIEGYLKKIPNALATRMK